MLIGPQTKRLSNATNAYDLLSDVIAYMLEEPKRVYMGDWLIKGKDRIKDTFETDGPACGTVGCIAGNVAVLTNFQTDPEDARFYLSSDNYGLRSHIYSDLFLDVKVPAKYGTKKYANIVARRIRAFQREWKADLQAVAIKPPKRGKQ
jgi:hypothetical protein